MGQSKFSKSFSKKFGVPRRKIDHNYMNLKKAAKTNPLDVARAKNDQTFI